MTGDQARALREELYDAGFRPVAISNPDADHPAAGKAPFGRDWTNAARQDPPEALRSLRLDALNTGILCDGLRALDIDVDDVALVQRIRATAIMAWGEAPMRVRDNSPRCLLAYRAAAGEPPKRQLAGKRGKVEVLGHGQQFVAYGRHPSGAELRWMGEPLHLVPREQLPAVTEEQVTRFFALVAPMLEAAGEKDGGSAAQPEDTGEVRALVEALAARGAGAFTEPSHLPPDAAGQLREALGRSHRATDRWEGFCDDLIGAGKDHSRSGMDMSLAALLKGAGAAPLDVALALLVFPHGAAQARDKHPTDALRLRYAARTAIRAGQARNDQAQGERGRDGAGNGAGRGQQGQSAGADKSGPKAEAAEWPEPNMAVLRRSATAPPALPLDCFGPWWARWISGAAKGANAPPDFVALPLLAVASALLGNARWARPWKGWAEPPALWCASVGNPSSGKSPGAAPVVRDTLGLVEAAMARDHPAALAKWQEQAAVGAAAAKEWERGVAAAVKAEEEPSPRPAAADCPPRPVRPRAKVSDATIEKLADLLAGLPKGLLHVRDELAGWLLNLSRYSGGTDRPFWLEAYIGGSYQVDRQKHPEPIRIPHLTVPIFGTIQPDRLAECLEGADDGLAGRFLWAWPDPLPFTRPDAAVDADAAAAMLLRLEALRMPKAEDGEPRPFYVPFSAEAAALVEDFARDVQAREAAAHGLMRTALGKARGQMVRLALVLEWLWWSTEGPEVPEPAEVGGDAAGAAAGLMDAYFLPMAARVLGDASIPDAERHARTLAEWIVATRPARVNVSAVRDGARLPGLRESEPVKAACRYLAEAGWLREPPRAGAGPGRPRGDWLVNPVLLGGNTET